MKLFLFWFFACFLGLAHAEDSSSEIEAASQKTQFKKAAALFAEGKYQATVEELTSIEEALQKEKAPPKATLGLVAYWKGISYNRLQDFPAAISQFDKSLTLGFEPLDINYEYGQALFASEKPSEARIQFRESLRKKFKRAVSLYYIAYLSKELGEKKKAVTFYKAIEKLSAEEAAEVRQAAETQIGDIYLDQVEKHSDAFRAVETYVIPQYQKALDLDKDSALVPQIKEKITQLQQKYDLILFKLRNGRPTLIPPYFLRISEEFGQDTNVTFAPTETTVSKSRQASLYSKSDFIGRYTFYYKNYISVAPEFRTNYTRYFHRVPEIYRNDNYLLAPALRTSYEHSLWKKPAATLVDFDYNYAERDVHSNQRLNFSSRSNTVMLGERLNYFDWGESIFRLRYRTFESYLSTNNSHTTSLVWEQVKTLKTNTLLFFGSYDMTRVKNNVYDTNSLTLRADLIMSRIGELFTPSFGLGITSTDPIHNRSGRGRELLINPSGRLSKTFGKNWRGNLKLDYQNNQSKDKTNFAYKKTIYAFELEYLF